MAARYRVTRSVRLVNWLMGVLLRLGVKPATTYLLTVRGRRSGRQRTTPVTLVEEGTRRWLVAPYGPVGWVRNARAAGQVTLTRGGRSETRRIAQVVDPAEAAPVLKMYAERVSITRRYFNAAHDAPVHAFVAEATNHPVFRILDDAVLTPS
jgi:deazaflavin-dependent oxidoreductase (nitroreductase family)